MMRAPTTQEMARVAFVTIGATVLVGVGMAVAVWKVADAILP